MAASKIEVTGIRELRRALKEAEDRSPKELQRANKGAAEIVVHRARILAPKGKHEGGGHVQPAWLSIKAQATSGRGLIAFGGNRSPHEPVVNFGGTIPRRGFKGLTRTEKAKGVRFTAGGERITSRKRVTGETRRGVAVTHVTGREHIYRSIDLERAHVVHEYEQALKRITKNL